MLPAALAILELLSACGSPLPTRRPVSRGFQRYAPATDTIGVEASLKVPAERIWGELPAVYAELGLPVNDSAPALRRLGTCFFRVRVRLAREMLSTYLDCGEINSLPNADRSEVTLTVLTRVRADRPGAATIATFVFGTTRGSEGVGSNPAWCYSNGTLEAAIRDALAKRLPALSP